MLSNDAEIERLTREMIAKYGPRAAEVAVYKVNEMIDRENPKGRDLWACVVHAIHDCQGTGPSLDERARPWQDIAMSGRPKSK